jgi:hypothetical protein
MFGSEILEVAIGVIFMFLLVSVICSAIREGIESWLKSRAAFLEYGIRELLHDKGATGLARSFYTHPFIYSLYANDYRPGPTKKPPSGIGRGRNLPSYIPARNFALALMDIAARGSTTVAASSDASAPTLSLQSVRENVANVENPHVQRALLAAVDTAEGDLDKAVANLAAWYDSGMDRVSGAYKRATQRIIFVIAVVVAVVMNVNTITIVDYLYNNDSARAVVVARAEAAARDSSLIKQGSTAAYQAARAELDSLSLPIGWSAGWGAPKPAHEWTGVWNSVLGPLLGWLLTALAATMGAPFWFDILNKVMVIRSTVKPHEKSPEESSEDRQKGADRRKQTAEGAVGEQPPAGEVAPLAPAAPGGAPPAPPAMPGPVTPAGPNRPDAENDVDGCDAEVARTTADENLPPAFGGVA